MIWLLAQQTPSWREPCIRDALWLVSTITDARNEVAVITSSGRGGDGNHLPDEGEASRAQLWGGTARYWSNTASLVLCVVCLTFQENMCQTSAVRQMIPSESCRRCFLPCPVCKARAGRKRLKALPPYSGTYPSVGGHCVFAPNLPSKSQGTRGLTRAGSKANPPGHEEIDTYFNRVQSFVKSCFKIAMRFSARYPLLLACHCHQRTDHVYVWNTQVLNRKLRNTPRKILN